MTSAATFARMDDLEWPRVLNRIITKRWSQLKNTLVMKDFVDYLIQKRVVTLDYWIGLKAKPITESERTEDFLALVMKFDQQKYQHFLESLLTIHRDDLVRELLKAQNSKLQHSDSRKGDYRDTENREVKRRSSRGQTDAEMPLTKPTMVNPSSSGARNSRDGHNGSQEAFGAGRKPAKPDSSDSAKIKQTNETDKPKKTSDVTQQVPLSQMSATDKLHHGIGTAVKAEVLLVSKSTPNDQRKQTKADNEQRNKTTVEGSKTAKAMELQKVENIEKPADESIKDSDSIKTIRPDTAKSKEELLDIREKEIKSRESELEKKAQLLQEQEEKLKIKETELITRENSLLTNRPRTTESTTSPSKLLREIQFGGISASSTTESSDVFADVREQLAAMKSVNEEIESEHTTSCNTPKEEYVKIEDFQTAQRELQELKDEMKTDKGKRKVIEQRVESLQHKVEDLKQEINDLKKEKDETNLQLTKELTKLRTEMTNAQKHHNERIDKLQNEMKAKDNECNELKSNIEDVVKTATDLEERVEILENEKGKQAEQVQAYQKEISFLQKQLQEKETEINDLKKVLEETENEKEELIEVLTELKKDVTKLKADKKQLEQDKKTLLGRCAKPNWNQNTRKMSFRN